MDEYDPTAEKVQELADRLHHVHDYLSNGVDECHSHTEELYEQLLETSGLAQENAAALKAVMKRQDRQIKILQQEVAKLKKHS